jgi:hypothetical protein
LPRRAKKLTRRQRKNRIRNALRLNNDEVPVEGVAFTFDSTHCRC